MSTDRKFTVVAAVVGVILVVSGAGCKLLDTIPRLNGELSQAVTNANELNSAMNSRTSPPGLIQNLQSASRGMTNVDGTLGQLGGSLTNLNAGMTAARTNLHDLSRTMVDLATPLGKLSNEVNGIRHEITNLHVGLGQLAGSIGVVQGQIGTNAADLNVNLPSSGLVGRLARTESALGSNTLAIAQVNASLTTNNSLLRESTAILKRFDPLKNVIPLLTAMLTLTSALWTAVNIGNTARKNAWDKVKDMGIDSLNQAWDDHKAGRTTVGTKSLETAISSVHDFRDAYAYAMFQLIIATFIIAAFFGEAIGPDWQTWATLAFLLSTGFASLIVLYTGDRQDVLRMFNGRWPLEKPCTFYWFCPIVESSRGPSRLRVTIAKALLVLTFLIMVTVFIITLTLRISKRLEGSSNASSTLPSTIGGRVERFGSSPLDQAAIYQNEAHTHAL